MAKYSVRLSGSSYPVLVGSGATAQLDRLLSVSVSGGRLFVVYDMQFYALHGPHLRRRAKALGRDAVELVLRSGESAKSMRVLRQLYDFFIAQNVSRSDFILAVGGGVITDLVGYAAATLLRGIRWGAVPTTLVGMVDAAIGGKTGVNHKRAKNLIGAFWQPSFVCVDPSLLHTLPRRHMVSGVGEIVKYCGLVGDKMSKPVESYLSGRELYDERLLVKLVSLSVSYKTEIVSRDERDQGVRMHLNLGHTFGHAIEAALGYGRLYHGEAVGLGLLGALELSALRRTRSARRLAEFKDHVIEYVKLLPRKKIDRDKLLTALRLDKKRRGDNLRFVLLDRPGKPFIDEHPERALVRDAVDRMLAQYAAAKE